MTIKWRIIITERERGWGSDSWPRDFDTEEEALKAMKEINDENVADSAPDYYIQVDRLPFPVKVKD